MKFKRIFLILASIQLLQPLTSVAMHSDDSYKTAAYLGFVGTTLGVLGTYLGFRYYQSQQPGKKVADAAQKKLPKNVQGLIGSFLQENGTLSHDEKLMFLPAILPINKKIVDTAMQKTIDENKKRMAALKEKECEAVADLLAGLQANSRERVTIALYAHVLSTRADQNTREIDLTDKQIENIKRSNHEQLFIKGKTSIPTLLGEPLFPGEVAFVGYSDGSVEIMITDADTETIKSLTGKERALLRKWHSPRIDHGMITYIKIVTSREWSEFQQIFTDKQKKRCVKRYYNLQVEGFQQPDWKKVTIFGAVGIALYIGIPSIRGFRWDLDRHKQYPNDPYYNPSCTWSNTFFLRSLSRIFNRIWSGSHA